MPLRMETVCIMADFGNAPYAWLRPEGEEPPYVGSGIADAVGGFSLGPPVSPSLEQSFAEWAIQFENECDGDGFDWKAWNDRGIELATRLAEEWKNRVRIEYHYPTEDPDPPVGYDIILICEGSGEDGASFG